VGVRAAPGLSLAFAFALALALAFAFAFAFALALAFAFAADGITCLWGVTGGGAERSDATRSERRARTEAV
jgi:hypothetical protein